MLKEHEDGSETSSLFSAMLGSERMNLNFDYKSIETRSSVDVSHRDISTTKAEMITKGIFRRLEDRFEKVESLPVFLMNPNTLIFREQIDLSDFY